MKPASFPAPCDFRRADGGRPNRARTKALNLLKLEKPEAKATSESGRVVS